MSHKREFVRSLHSMSVPARFTTVGMLCAGVVGAIVGLIVGLQVYAPTPWFAVFELGVPSAIVGAVMGLLTGASTVAVTAQSGTSSNGTRIRDGTEIAPAPSGSPSFRYGPKRSPASGQLTKLLVSGARASGTARSRQLLRRSSSHARRTRGLAAYTNHRVCARCHEPGCRRCQSHPGCP